MSVYADKVPFRPEFVLVDYEVFVDPDLSPSAKLLFARLKLYAGQDGQAYPKHETLAREMCVSDRQVRTVLAELRALNRIAWKRTRGSCRFEIKPPEEWRKASSLDGMESSALTGRKLPIKTGRNVPTEKKYRNHHQKHDSKGRNQDTAHVGGDVEPIFDTPEARLKAWAARRGDPLSQKDWWDIKAEAEVRGLGLNELARLAEKNDGNWKSSGAGLRWLLKKYSQKATDAPQEAPTEVVKTKCQRCRADNGRGAILEGDRAVPCPDCATPEWVTNLNRSEDERIKRRAAGKPAESVALTQRDDGMLSVMRPV